MSEKNEDITRVVEIFADYFQAMLTRELAQAMAHVNERLELTAKRLEAIEIGMRDLIARTDATHIDVIDRLARLEAQGNAKQEGGQ